MMLYSEEEVEEARQRVLALTDKLSTALEGAKMRDVLTALANETSNVLLSQSSWTLEQAVDNYAQMLRQIYQGKLEFMRSGSEN